MGYEFLDVRREGPVEYVTLNRPDVRNAFNEQLIGELTRWAAEVAGDDQVRAAVLAGAGKAFCAGADLTWMSRMVAYTHDENVQDASAMAQHVREPRPPADRAGRPRAWRRARRWCRPGGGLRHRGGRGAARRSGSPR